MKTNLSLFVIAMALAFQTFGQKSSENTVTETILSGYSVKAFSSEPLSEKAIDLILECGIKAPSARNSQLWKFTVIYEENLISQIVRNPVPGNVLIIVSGSASTQEGINVDFDCALATENMYVAAQSLGLGAHIYTGPVRNINAKKQEFGIPEGYRAVSALRIGHIDEKVDAASSASPRKEKEEIVNTLK
ncbi:nitroreductase [Maribellus comscasis]|uniref:Nitroreductase n=1 Tax=Maribellus comscasis TaxID=2681766 RepID=A0A6I6JUM6_9BACT|nr:nitroreductase family protein [Maribellus comscasis]QGY46825.1 nitroreductase [Maribellus comscasis]